MELNMSGWRSQLPVVGNILGLDQQNILLVDLPLSEQDVGYPGLGFNARFLWIPEVPNGTKVPVIATIDRTMILEVKELSERILIRIQYLTRVLDYGF